MVDVLDVVTWKKPDEGLLLLLFYQVLYEVTVVE